MTNQKGTPPARASPAHRSLSPTMDGSASENGHLSSPSPTPAERLSAPDHDFAVRFPRQLWADITTMREDDNDTRVALNDLSVEWRDCFSELVSGALDVPLYDLRVGLRDRMDWLRTGTHEAFHELRVELGDCLNRLVFSLVMMSWKGTVVRMDPSFSKLSSLVKCASNMLNVLTIHMVYPDSPVCFDSSSMSFTYPRDPVDEFWPRSVTDLMFEVLHYLTELTEELGILPAKFMSDTDEGAFSDDGGVQSKRLFKLRCQLLDALEGELTIDSIVSAVSETHCNLRDEDLPLLRVDSNTRNALYSALEAMIVAKKMPHTFVKAFSRAYRYCFLQVNVIFHLIPSHVTEDTAMLRHAQTLQSMIMFSNVMAPSPIGMRPSMMLSFIEEIFYPILAMTAALHILPELSLGHVQSDETNQGSQQQRRAIPIGILLDVFARHCASVVDFTSCGRPACADTSSSPPTSHLDQGDLCEIAETQDVHAVSFCRDAIWLGAKHDGYPVVPFQDYKFRREHIASLDLHRRQNSPLYAALHQSQLTFGILETFLDVHIPERHLLRRMPDGTMLITTQKVLLLLQDCHRRMRNLKESNFDALKQWMERAQDALKISTALIVWEGYADYRTFSNVALSSQDIARILFMATTLNEVLFDFLIEEAQGLSSVNLRSLTVPSRIFDDCRREMVADGWCPFTVARLASDSPCTLGFASMRKLHVSGGVGHREHTRCTNKMCVSSNIDPVSYNNLHVTEGCTCTSVTPPIDQIKSALLHHEIPIVRIMDNVRQSSREARGTRTYSPDDPDRPDIEMECRSTSSGTPYIAISHVWSDGLGSTTERGLLICQLRRLAEYAHQMVDGGYLWLDALCIPGEQGARKLAIGMIGETYQRAHAVLVLDSGIQSCSVAAPMEQKLLCIVTSRWMQRLWTLQEAVLASNLIFQFSDGRLALRDLVGYWRAETRPVARQLNVAFLYIIVLSTPPAIQPLSIQLRIIIDALRGRSTNKPSDETLAISFLLGVDSFALANIEESTERMKALLLGVREVPLELPFLRNIPRLTDPGFRWAPETLLQPGDAARISTDGSALCTTEGLLAKCYYFLVRRPIALHRRTVILSDITNNGEAHALYYASVDEPVQPIPGEKLCNAIILQNRLGPLVANN
ncbi:hypothetical protein CERSUDRAFT_126427, partial [Gelatoporia subvermispora B]